MAKRRGGRFKKMLGLGFISFEKAFSESGRILTGNPVYVCHQCHKIKKNSKKISDTFCYELALIPTKKNSKKIRIFIKKIFE
jgi:hypothetical protein